MEKRGDLKISVLIFLILAIAVIGFTLSILAYFSGRVNVIPTIINFFFPGEQNETFSSSNNLGLVLNEDLELAYFSGVGDGSGEWIYVGDEVDTFALGSRKFDHEETRQAFFDFYFETDRKPPLSGEESGYYGVAYAEPDFDVVGERELVWLVAKPNPGLSLNERLAPEWVGGTYVPYHDLTFIEAVREPFVGNRLKVFNVGFGRLFETRGAGFKGDMIGQGETASYSDTIASVNAWTNQILQGGEFERFLQMDYERLVLNAEPEPVSGKYRVRGDVRSGGFPVIYVELDRPVTNEVEKYGNPYVPEPEPEYVNDRHIIIDFELKNGVDELFFGNPPGFEGISDKAWYAKSEDGQYYFLGNVNAGDFQLSDPEIAFDLIEGLDHITNIFDGFFSNHQDIRAYLVKAPDYVKGSPVASYDDLEDDDDKEELRETVVRAYNEAFEVVEEEAG